MKKLLLPFFLTGTLAMMVVMAKTGATLKTAATPLGILNLEFAYNNSKATAVVNAWSAGVAVDNIRVAQVNTWWDFLFLFFYAGFLCLACTKISKNIGGSFGKAGKQIAKGALLAGFLDIIENTGMLLTLSNKGSSIIAFVTTFVSVIKWVLALIALLYVLTGIILLVFRKR